MTHDPRLECDECGELYEGASLTPLDVILVCEECLEELAEESLEYP